MAGKPDLTVTDGQAGLHVTNLRKSYRKKTVIRDVSLDLGRGEVVALLGPNGSGKTTTFYAIAGLVSPEGGQVMIDGRDVTYLPMYRRAKLGIGYLPQEASIFRKLTVNENIMAILETRPLNKSERQERLEELLSDLQIEHIQESTGISLSGGERRRVEIARALAAEPDFILLDEPFAGVDPLSVIDIQKIIRELTAKGIGILITDHNVRETLGICHRAYILSGGQVIAEGTPDQVLNDKQVKDVYLGQNFRL